MNENVLLILSSVVTSIVTWLLTRRKINAEAESSELDNVAKAVKVWRELNEELELRFNHEIDLLRRENCDLRNQVSEVMKKNEEMRAQMEALEIENRKLIEQLMIFNKNNHDGKIR